MNPIEQLHVSSRRFGRGCADAKLRLLDRIGVDELRKAELVDLQGCLNFMRAYPDDARVRARVRALVAALRKRGAKLARGLRDQGFPGSHNVYEYSFGVVEQLVEDHPEALEIEWEELEDTGLLMEGLERLVSVGESEGLNDPRLELSEWMGRSRPSGCPSDLAHLIHLFQRSGLDPLTRVILYEAAGIPVRLDFASARAGRCEAALAVDRVHYQKRDISRERFPLEPRIREPLRVGRPLPASRAREVIRVALEALCSRNLEIHAIIYANPRDTTLVQLPRGVQVAIIGTLPAHRSALECIYAFVIFKNGVPLAYGPAGIFQGCCELGINLFPEFRGAEIRHLYSQVMRVLHHGLSVRYFFLQPYGMGKDNEEAIRSGAFWFYRKLGFAAANPRVEALARVEEGRMCAEPGYRPGIRTLRRLSDTIAYLDLSGGGCRPFDFGMLGRALSRWIGEEHGGDRDRAERMGAARLARLLGRGDPDSLPPDLGRAYRRLGPILAMVPDLDGWGERDLASLRRIVDSKGGPSERAAGRGFDRHRRLRHALRRLSDTEG